MLTANLLAFLICLLPSLSQTQSTVYPNALALLEAQGDVTIITTLVRRDPELVDLLSSAKNITFFAAPDYTFGAVDLNAPPFTNKTFANAVIKQLTLDGSHPTSDFTTQPQYFNSRLTDRAYVNLSRGAAVGRLVKFDDNRNNFRAGSGTNANVIDSRANLHFNGGIVHITDGPINVPLTIPSTFANPNSPVAPNYSILNATALGLLDTLTATTDVPLFALTNPAFETAVTGLLNSTTQCLAGHSLLQSLKYYAIAPGVYYADSFTGREVRTLSGENVTLSGVGDFPTGLRVNDAEVAVEDVFVRNGGCACA
ncbi:MAG: hypothetical protein Q9222_001819 [Ikaeria aurantiellina]